MLSNKILFNRAYHRIKRSNENINFNENEMNNHQDLITEEDWLKLLVYYEDFYIKNLKNEYIQAYNKIKHLRNEHFLNLLNKISNESKNMKNYINNNNKSLEHHTNYWSKLTIKDFDI
jgi:hypothetical protein